MNNRFDDTKLESELDHIFHPVTPSNDFVSDLQERLKSKVEILVEYPDYLLPIILISTGLLFGVVLIWILTKLFKFITKDSRK